MNTILVPHLRYPLALAGTRLAVVEQDTLDDVRQCVQVILRTPRGTRPLALALGVQDPTFVGIDPGELEQDIRTQEPRARADVTVTQTDGEMQVTVGVQLADPDPDLPDLPADPDPDDEDID